MPAELIIKQRKTNTRAAIYMYTKESTYLSAGEREREDGWCEPKNWLNFTSMLTTPLPAALSNVREIKHGRASRIEI
jgi:hypothetical protein